LIYAFGDRIAPESVLTIVTLVASLALLVWIDTRLKRYTNTALLYSLQLLLAAMISYHFYPHDGAVLVLPFLILLGRALEPGAERSFKIAVLLCSGCAYLAPFVAGMYVGMPIIGLSSLALLVIARREALKLSIVSALPARPDSINVAS